MSHALVFDTSIATKNLGDLIICDAVYDHLREVLPGFHFMNTATHDYIGRESYKLNRISDFSFVAGSNLLSSNMNSYNQWKINLFDAIFLRNITLVGVGWWQYQNIPNLYTKLILKTILTKKGIHSVRDEYTLLQLRSIGISNVINTGCPTTWKLNAEHCSLIPKIKSNKVVFTLTDYNRNEDTDKFLVNLLLDNYEEVYFWPQGGGDLIYLKSLIDIRKINVLFPSLDSYNEILEDSDVEYIGTRLHAGIRALQYKRRTLILAVDNRAIEMQKDIDLPVCMRSDFSQVEEFVLKSFDTKINIKTTEISQWKRQFVK